MFDWKNFEKHRNIFSHAGPDHYKDLWGQHHVNLRPRDLLKWVEFCRDDMDYILLTDIVGADRKQLPFKWGQAFELVYSLFNMGSHQRLNLHLHFNVDEVVPSIVPYFPHAEWMEREQSEMLGIKFMTQMEGLLLPEGTTFRPLRRDEKIGQWQSVPSTMLPKLRMNPNKSEPPYAEESWQWKRFDVLTAETMGNFQMDVCFDPKKVVDSKVRIGFHHRGIEKLLEGKNWMHVMQLADMIHPGAAPTYSTAWAKLLEDMLRVKLPERAQAIRIVMLELARVAEHLTVLHEVLLSLKKDEHRLFLDAREKIYELFEKYCGHRQGKGIVCLGGVKEDLPHGWIVEYQSISDLLLKNLRLIHKSLISQRHFRSHLDCAGVNAQTVLQWGVGGPTMRASGLNFDLRKSCPFYFYQDIDFDVPVGIHGTSYDRYLIRYEEIRQSLRIVTQVLDNLPLGEYHNKTLVGDYKSTLSLVRDIPNSWHYSSLESPNGEAGFFLLHSEQNPYRLKVKSPSFTLSQALPHFIRGHQEWQVQAAIASLGIRKTEQDR